MDQEPRKATEVILDLESKITTLLGTIKMMDLNIKVISNKLNELNETVKGLGQQASASKVVVEAVHTTSVPNQAVNVFGITPMPVDPARAVPITAESKLPAEDQPAGFRRTSRSESYAGSDDYLKRDGVPPPHNDLTARTSAANKPPPGRTVGEPLPAQPVPKNKAATPPTNSPTKVPTELDTHGIVPVEQRVVDRNGKSVFLADVEIVDLSSGEQVSKSRTNGTGKWMAALPLGNYKVVIRKLESLTREKVESTQTIQVDGHQSPLKLQMVIIK